MDIYEEYINEDKRKMFLKNLENSVGFSESKDQVEFRKGAMICYDWLFKELQDKFKWQAHSLKCAQGSVEYYKTDLETICSLISKHTPENF